MADTGTLFGARVVRLHKTCGACPTQWQGTLSNGQSIYIRYRWGRLQIGVGKGVDAAVDATISGEEDVNYVEAQVGHDFDGHIYYDEMVRVAAGLVPELDFAPINAQVDDPDEE